MLDNGPIVEHAYSMLPDESSKQRPWLHALRRTTELQWVPAGELLVPDVPTAPEIVGAFWQTVINVALCV
jgi:hypothetical protein